VKFLSSMVLVIVQNLLFDLTERRFLQWLCQDEFKTLQGKRSQ
jgi:hypothetical protein